VNRSLLTALIAGVVAGLVLALVQHYTTTPLIKAAEVYEQGAADAAAHGGHEHGWAPEGLTRTLSTTIGTLATSVGFALVLIAVMRLAGETIRPSTAAAWACAAFACTGLATAFGLAPALPGSAEGELLLRQAWWVGTVIASGAGLFLIFRVKGALASVIGVALIAAPHLIGAPRPEGFASTAPAELASEFASTSLGLQALLWLMIGTLTGIVWPRLADR
jgi:cobalt transporter subunit CbtA